MRIHIKISTKLILKWKLFWYLVELNANWWKIGTKIVHNLCHNRYHEWNQIVPNCTKILTTATKWFEINTTIGRKLVAKKNSPWKKISLRNRSSSRNWRMLNNLVWNRSSPYFNQFRNVLYKERGRERERKVKGDKLKIH